MRKTSAPPAFLEYSAGLALRCPVCGTCGTESVLHPFATSGNVDCTRCSFQMAEENGIWQAIAPDRVQYFAKFVSEYEHVRKAEGRGSATSEYYLELPFHGQFEVARTFTLFEMFCHCSLKQRMKRSMCWTLARVMDGYPTD